MASNKPTELLTIMITEQGEFELVSRQVDKEEAIAAMELDGSHIEVTGQTDVEYDLWLLPVLSVARAADPSERKNVVVDDLEPVVACNAKRAFDDDMLLVATPHTLPADVRRAALAKSLAAIAELLTAASDSESDSDA